MVSIAIMIGGAVLNATAFIGGNYLARALGRGGKAALEEKVPQQGSRRLSSGLCQIHARPDTTSRLDHDQRANKAAGQAEHDQHGLRLQTLQPGAS